MGNVQVGVIVVESGFLYEWKTSEKNVIMAIFVETPY